MQALTNLYRSIESTFYYTKENLPGYLEEPIKKGDLDAIRSLCSLGVDLEGLRIQGQSLTEFTYRQCEEKRNEVLTILLEKGADATTCDGTPTPILLLEDHWSVHASNISAKELQEYFDLVKIFEEAGVEVTSWINPILDEEENTLLHLTAEEGNWEAVELLVEKSPLLDPENKSGETPLYSAISDSQHASNPEDYEKTVQLLLESGASVSTKENEWGQTPLHEAAIWGIAKIVELLLSYGARLEEKNLQGETPLFIATRFGKVGAMGLLLKAGAKLDVTDIDGQTLFQERKWNHEETLIALFLAGCEEAKGPLYAYKTDDYFCVAILSKHPWLLKAAIERDPSKVQEPLSSGYLPLHLAIGVSKSEVEREKVELLLKAGIDPNQTDQDGETPLSLVTYKRHRTLSKCIRDGEESTVKLLFKHGAKPEGELLAFLNGKFGEEKIKKWKTQNEEG